MEVDIITKKDLEAFRRTLVLEIKELLEPHAQEKGEWLKSAEVRDILQVSPGSLQNLRIHGKLNPVKIGGVYYYKRAEVNALFEENT